MVKHPPVVLVLDLSRHCIETAIRKRYDAAVGTYFKHRQERPHLEHDIALLLEALETLEFSTLRAAHPALAGSTEALITLSKEPEGTLTIHIDGQPLTDLPIR